MNHPSAAPLGKDKKKVGRTKESARKQEGPLIPRGLFLIRLSRVFVPLSRKSARYRPRTLFLLQPLDCGLSFQARLRVSYPHNSESSFSLLVLDPQQVSRPYFLG